MCKLSKSIWVKNNFSLFYKGGKIETIMSSQITHLAVAKRYLEKHPYAIKNVQAFLDGNVAPDLAPNKAVSHCGKRTERGSMIKYNLEKVSPLNFLEIHDMTDDFNKGQYLHLYVDYECYNHFLFGYYQRATSSEQASVDMYEVSRRDDKYLRQKYGVDYFDTSLGKELQKINDEWDAEYVIKRQRPTYRFELPYDFQSLEQFIEQMSDVEIPQ